MSKHKEPAEEKNFNIWTSPRSSWDFSLFKEEITDHVEKQLNKASIGTYANIKERVKAFDTKLSNKTLSLIIE